MSEETVEFLFGDTREVPPQRRFVGLRIEGIRFPVARGRKRASHEASLPGGRANRDSR